EFRLRQLLEVLDVKGLPITYRTPSHPVGACRNGSAYGLAGGRWPMCCDESKQLAFQAPDRGIGRAAEASGAFGDDVHHGLDVRRRVGAAPQDLRRRHLLLERLREVTVSSLELVEQADILNGDHGLVGEGF